MKISANKKILIVEDESSIADNIRYALEAEGFEPDWVSTLQEARSQFALQAYVLMILDVGLPDGDGFSFCQEIRKTSAIPILFLTARSSEIDRVVGLELGGDDYMVKPFSPRELAARVKAILRRSQSDAENREESSMLGEKEFKTGDPNWPFKINQEKRKIFYFDQALSLSRYEHLLLEAFLQKPGRVFTRDQLMAKVWDDPGSSFDRTVDAHIKALRAKLKSIHPQVDPIETHRGVGYALREEFS